MFDKSQDLERCLKAFVQEVSITGIKQLSPEQAEQLLFEFVDRWRSAGPIVSVEQRLGPQGKWRPVGAFKARDLDAAIEATT
jgi:hypothetical protein